jgi:hypothetical protein
MEKTDYFFRFPASKRSPTVFGGPSKGALIRPHFNEHMRPPVDSSPVVFTSDQERSLGYDIQQYCAEEGIICEFSVVVTRIWLSFPQNQLPIIQVGATLISSFGLFA